MDRQPMSPPSVHPGVQALVEEYRAALAAGGGPTAEELLAREPELAEQLRPLLEALAATPGPATPTEQATLDFPDGPFTRSEQPTLAGLVPPPQASYCGMTFGDYELVEEIARGGMGVVYKARQKSLNRVVALKMILAGQFASADHVRRFHVEAEEAGRLAHPHIVPIYQVGEEGGQHYYSMKLIAGGSLAARLGRYRGDAEASARLVATVARAVHDAHLHGVLHRDLKPGNILIDEEGQPHVTDFGLAKHIDAGGPGGETCSGTIVGTPAYMAPEQAAAKKGLTIAADVYSLGAILYELLTGRPPFQADSPMETLLQVIDQEPAPPRSLDARVPVDLETICLKCLEKAPGKRYVSGLSLALDLERYLNGEPIYARPVGRVERAWKWARRRPAAAALAAVSAVAAASLLVGGWWSSAQMRDANARLEGALAEAEWRRVEAEEQRGLAEGRKKEADRLRGVAEEGRREAQRRRSEAEQRRREAQESARLARQERERAEEGFRKRIETIDDLLINLDGQLANESGVESLRVQFLQDFLVFARQMVDEQKGDATARRQLGRIYARLGDVNDTMERYQSADRAFRQALEVQEGLAKEEPGRAEYRADLALTTYQHAAMLRNAGRYADARRAFERAIALQDGLVRDFPDRTAERARQRTVRFRFDLANMLEQARQPGAALGVYRAALDRQERIVAATGDAAEQNYLGLIADSLASMLSAARPGESQRLLERSLKARRRAWEQAPHLGSYSRELRESYSELGSFLLKRHRHAELARLADELCQDFPGTKIDTYNAACLMGNAAAAARKAPGLGEEERGRLADRYAERAVKLLDKAIQVGYDERSHMDKDPDLDALRGREDYKRLMANLDAKLPARRPLTVAEELAAMTGDYSDALRSFQSKYNRARTVAQVRRAMASRPNFQTYAERVLAFAQKHKEDPAAVDAIHWVLYRSDPSVAGSQAPARAPARQRALELLARDHLNKPDLSEVCRQLATLAGPTTDKLLTAILEKHDKKDQRGIALFALGLSLARQAEQLQEGKPAQARELARQAEAKLAQVVKDHAEVPLSKSTLGEMARKKLHEVKFLSVGAAAQEIDGEGLDGRRMKLSDHRGKVVLLDFWANWCGYCRQQYAHRRQLAARLKGRPFAMVGVNSDDDKATVQAVVAKQKLPGSHWWDGGGVGGRISERWQIDSFPTVYLLDHKGVIRYKGLRGEALDRAIDGLLSEQAAERPGR